MIAVVAPVGLATVALVFAEIVAGLVMSAEFARAVWVAEAVESVEVRMSYSFVGFLEALGAAVTFAVEQLMWVSLLLPASQHFREILLLR